MRCRRRRRRVDPLIILLSSRVSGAARKIDRENLPPGRLEGGARRRGGEREPMNHTHAAGRSRGGIDGGKASRRATGTHKINTLFTRRRGLYARRTHVVVSAQRRRRARRLYTHTAVTTTCPRAARRLRAVRVNLKTRRRAASPRCSARPHGRANAPAPWRPLTP